MTQHMYKTLFAYSLASLLAFPPLVFASAGKSRHTEEHESVDVEHRTTNEQKEVDHDATPEFSRSQDEHQGIHQEVTKEHKEIHRELKDQKDSHHDD